MAVAKPLLMRSWAISYHIYSRLRKDVSGVEGKHHWNILVLINSPLQEKSEGA